MSRAQSGHGGQDDEEADPAHRSDVGRARPHMAPRGVVPYRPCGRTSSTSSRITKNVISDQLGEIVAATTAELVDTMSEPDDRAPDAAQTAEENDSTEAWR